MSDYICVTCGTQYGDPLRPPARCAICSDDRQFVGWNGQEWTTLPKMRRKGFRNVIGPIRPGLMQIITSPSFGIGQRAILVLADAGNILWDCTAYLDQETVSKIKALGGIAGIAISHPHFYTTMVEWSEAFGRIPIYLHQLDRKWVKRTSTAIDYWKGKAKRLLPGVEILKLGGHFPGSSVLYLHQGGFSDGVVLSGDTINVEMDRRWMSFMYSFPNHLPLSERKVRDIAQRMKGYKFEEIFCAVEGRQLIDNAGSAVQRSAKRYVRHLRH
jgi:glyoxylase-like metal-dependent hydrolase (beta-lactamase superfamily II)